MNFGINRINKKGLLGRSAGLIALCGALIAAGPAFCQSAAAQTGTDPGGADAATTAQTADQLQEVVVTAERRATDIMATPVSIVAVSGSQLQQSQIVDVNSLGQVAPSLLVVNAGLNSTADIRGVGNSNQGGNETPGVAMVRDGLPNVSEGVGENIPYYDIADVEVLRGPQGTFNEASSTGGTININSANPNFRGVNGYVDATAATYTEQRLQGAVNLPVSDTLALRLAFNEETRGSFFRDEATILDGPYEGGPIIGESGPKPGVSAGNTPNSIDLAAYDPGNVDDKDVRLGILWKPTDHFQMLTKIEFDNEDSEGVPTQPDVYPFTPLAPGLPCPAGHTTTAGGACLATWAQGYSGSPYELNDWGSSILKADNDEGTYNEEVRYTLPSGIVLRFQGGLQTIFQTSVSDTSHDQLDQGSYSQAITDDKIYSGELDAISPTDGPFSWITGTMYSELFWHPVSYSVNVNAPYSPTNPEYGALWSDGEVIRNYAHAVFGQLSYQFTPTLQVVGGARMTWDGQQSLCTGYSCGPTQQEYVIYASGAGGGQFTYIGGHPGPHATDRVPTGKIDVNWTPLAGQLFYAFVARGAKPGESNAGSATIEQPPTHYEWVTDYEAGWKGKLANGHLNIQLDGYYMQYMDMIHSIFNPAIPTGTGEANIPESILKGIEFTLNANFGHLGIDVNAADDKSILGPLSTAATYKFPSGTNFGQTPQCRPGVPPNNLSVNAGGCSDYTGSYPGDPSYVVNLNGESLPFAPQYTLNAAVRYSIPLGNTYLTPRVSYSYRSKAYSDIFESDDYYLLPGYSLVNAYLEWDASAWTTTVYATNLTNSVYLEGTGLYGDPRQLGLEFRRSF
ncbi:MAG TPA: TonB-dependent receptor [Steroidobacteraceae bacterium]|nr:TonB-dependent receptor [Steroidobacteraceae bacterium]